MKILGVSGSNRKNGNSYLFLREILKDLPRIETEIVQVAELNIKPCELCIDSCSLKPFKCVIDDDIAVLFEKMKAADGIIFACPFYFYVPAKFHHLQEFALMLKMRPITTDDWPYIGFSAKSGEMEKGAILREKEVIEKGRKLVELLIKEIGKKKD